MIRLARRISGVCATPGGGRRRSREDGLTLMSVLLWMLLLSSLALFLSARIASHAAATGDAERQLYSLVLAGNGVEFARAVLPALDLNRLLEGPDGVLESSEGRMEPRNPMTLQLARVADPREWEPDRDDGLPWTENGMLLPRGYWAESSGYFFLRFSNNVEEGDGPDRDGIVIVRSMGIAPSRFLHPLFPSVRNSVSVVEARLRQERGFELPAPIVCFGETGEFQWEGDRFSVEGGEAPAVGLVVLPGGTLYSDLRNSLSPSQQSLLQGKGLSPSVEDATGGFREDPAKKSLFSAVSWNHFQENLPDFAGRLEDVRYYPEGAILEGLFEGIVLARGDVTLRDARIRGILIHLGEGELLLAGESEIQGGMWMSNVQAGAELAVGPIRLRVADRVRVRYDRGLVRQAISRFPVTQSGWRIIFPEMEQ